MAPNTLSVDDGNLEAQEENFIAILALVILLIFFFAYCCWGTSCCENVSSRLNLCRQGNAESQNVRGLDTDQTTGNPTIILLPHGRILVVDGSVFARFHANSTGLDLFELGDTVLRDETRQRPRSPRFSEMDSETIVKDCPFPSSSPLPPTYESIFGDYQQSTPPPYSEALQAEQQPNRRRTDEEIDRESTL